MKGDFEFGERSAIEAAASGLPAAGELAEIPRDRNWLIGMALLAECLVCVKDDRLSEQVLEALRPYHKLNVVLGNGSRFHGNTSHFLGLLSASNGRGDEALALASRVKIPALRPLGNA